MPRLVLFLNDVTISRFPLLPFLVLTTFIGCVENPIPETPEPDGTTVILVRHAERIDDSPDAELSPEGKERAELLARMLIRANPQALFASQFYRTQQTLRPLAEQLGLPIRIVNAEAVDELVNTIQQDHRGKVTVVASHSDRVPVLVERMTGTAIEPIDHAEYDRLYVLTLLAPGSGRALELRYGVNSGAR